MRASITSRTGASPSTTSGPRTGGRATCAAGSRWSSRYATPPRARASIASSPPSSLIRPHGSSPPTAPTRSAPNGRATARARSSDSGGPGLRGRLEEEVRVLVVGGGGREHALCWALQRDLPDATLYAAPGNPGTARHGSNLRIPATAVHDLVAAAVEHKIDLTVVGPEAPLAAGLV